MTDGRHDQTGGRLKLLFLSEFGLFVCNLGFSSAEDAIVLLDKCMQKTLSC